MTPSVKQGIEIIIPSALLLPSLEPRPGLLKSEYPKEQASDAALCNLLVCLPTCDIQDYTPLPLSVVGMVIGPPGELSSLAVKTSTQFW